MMVIKINSLIREILPLSVICLLLSCSTAKNTAVRRGFHQMKVKYNIFFNGNTAFLEGQQAIIEANEDDYTQVLNLYPVSNHKAAEQSASQMERTIEKCRKCIKLHSIQVKPKINPNKRNDPKYKLWLEQREFNNQMANAWIRLGEAEFHKGDFLGSIGTFTYVAKHYDYDLDVVTRCQLWMARAYAELGWEHEADDMLNKAQVDNLKHRNAHLYSNTFADILLKKKQYEPAIPFIEKALPNEKRNLYKPRFQYVLGQLYEMQGQRDKAYGAYKQVTKMSPPFEMDFNARIKLTQLNPKHAERKLRTMLKQSKYSERLEVIYGALGDLALSKKDTSSALTHYQLALDTCKEENYTKASIAIKMGDIYYQQKQYRLAQPCYRSASNIITPDHPEYDRISKLNEALDELIGEYEVIQLQDSLQKLSLLSKDEQLSVVEKIIEDLKQKEKAEAQRAQQEARNSQNRGVRSVDTQKMFGDKTANTAWYFYNDQLVRTGKGQFQNKWGSRPLEDNWRRLSKGLTSSSTDAESINGDTLTNMPGSEGANRNESMSKSAPSTQPNDIYQPEFYLRQIPKNKSDLIQSDSLIKNALFNMIFTYLDKIENYEEAYATFEEYRRRFPNDAKLPELYFTLYMNCLYRNENAKAQEFKEELVQQFPKSKQALAVSNPNHLVDMKNTLNKQDSLYEDTYNAFKENQFKKVHRNASFAKKHFSMSPLLPNFLLLDAIGSARTEGHDAFLTKLKQLVDEFPDSESGALARTFLSLINEGKQAKRGKLSHDLDSMRLTSPRQEDEETVLNLAQDSFSLDISQPSIVLFVTATPDEKTLNNLLYEVALFNFSQFLIKDFDIKVSPIFGDVSAIRVVGFENIKESQWYKGIIVKNKKLSDFLQANKIKVVSVTEENSKLINTKYTLDEYIKFYKRLN